MRIQVDPGALQSGGAALAGSASNVKTARGDLANALGAVGAMGDAGVAGAYATMCGAWAQTLGTLDRHIEALGRTTQSAGGAYTTTDQNAIPAGP
jgi:uncharacterized protein YukE